MIREYYSDSQLLPLNETASWNLHLPEGNKRILAIQFPADLLYELNLHATWNYVSLRDAMIESKFPIELGEKPGNLSIYAQNIGVVVGGRTIELRCRAIVELTATTDPNSAAMVSPDFRLVDPTGKTIKANIAIKGEDK